jgi:hypothetical protein
VAVGGAHSRARALYGHKLSLDPSRGPREVQLSGRKAIECFQDGLFQPTPSLSRACPSSAARAHWVAAWHVHQHHVCKSSWASSRSPRTSAGLAASAQMLRPSNRSCSPAASSAGRKVHGAQLQTWPRVRVRRSPRPASGATTLSSRVVSECSVAAAATFIACVGSARADGLASDATSAHGVEVIDLEPRRRPQGRRFVLHRTCGPRFCPRWVCAFSPAGLTGTVASSAPIVGV